MQQLLGYGYSGAASEYHADCLAGLFTRWGYATGRLTGNDYWEIYYWFYNQYPSQSHGTAEGRTSWYRYGYEQYSLSACNQVLGRNKTRKQDDGNNPIVERPQTTDWRLSDEQKARIDRAIGRGQEHGFDSTPGGGLPEE